MQKLLYVGVGGFIGASLRYIFTISISKLMGTNFPYGTLVVNVLGGILIGFIMQLSLTNNIITPNLRLFLTTGILGGLTTFSTFSYESINLFNDSKYLLGIVNISSNLFLSLIGVILGKNISNML